MKTLPPPNIIAAMTEKAWWGTWFARGDWSRWHPFLKAVFGLEMTETEHAVYFACTGRQDPPAARVSEAFAICGRRAGKTRIMALIAAWLALFDTDWRDYLDPGEVAHILVVAKDTTQAAVAFGYLSSLILEHELLRNLVVSSTSDTIELRNHVILRVAAASFRSLRGFAVAALIADELSYWFDGEISANPAEEIIAAVRPAMLQFEGRAMLLAASSPYRRTGPMWQAFCQHFGKPSPVLIWKAPTTTMNPAAPTGEIERAYAEDAEKAASEYGAEFRRDIAPFVDREAVEACVAVGRRELPPVSGTVYAGFSDVSAGANDSFVSAVSHVDAEGRAILDAVIETRAPFNPEEVTATHAELYRRYGVDRIEGDAFAGEWPREQFRKRGIVYEVSKRSKSLLYIDVLPAINAGKVELLDNAILINQFAALERKTSRAGRDIIDHPIGGRDDVCNAVAGALLLALDRAAPALWSAGTNLPEWRPVGCDMLVSFVAVDRDGALIVLHCLGNQLARSKPHCIFADATALPVSALSQIPNAQSEVSERNEVLLAQHPIYFIDDILVPPAKAAGLPAHHVSELIPPALVADHRALALAAAAHVGAGAVAVTPEFVERANSLPIGSVLSMRLRAEPDPATLAAVMAICMCAGDPRRLARALPRAAA
jgi:hypothetical protein